MTTPPKPLSAPGERDAQGATCDYYGCPAPVRVQDINFKPPSFRLCVKHGAELDALVVEVNAKKILGFWVKAQGGPKRAARRLMDEARPGIERLQKLAVTVSGDAGASE